MKRNIFAAEHEDFRAMFRDFLKREVVPVYADARVSRIYGGTSEVLKLIISKSSGL